MSMNKEYEIEELKYYISDIIGPDISYTRGESEDQYLTGIEFSLLLSSGLISCFLIPFIKNFAKKLGEETASALIEKLNRNKREVENKNLDSMTMVDENIQIVINDLNIIFEVGVKGYEPNNFLKEKEETEDFLVLNGFPSDKAKIISNATVDKITNLFCRNDK